MLAQGQRSRGKKDGDKRPSALEHPLQGLMPAAEQAARELPGGASADEIAAHAVKVNVISTMDRLLEFSEPLRERVRRREVQVHGAICDLANGRVDLLGQSPNLGRLADSTAPRPLVPTRFGQAPEVEQREPEVEQREPEAEEETKEPEAPQVQPAEAPEGPLPTDRPASSGSRGNKGGVGTRFRRWFQHLG
uniref:Carbonic anhydrase n=1 Tax=Alexandrium monilatum TaxID=311494 RepID=A0A6T1M7U8_9DINO